MNGIPSEDAGSAARCPSCERYIGPVGSCPYCGTDSDRPPAIRALRLAALTLAGVGLLFLYLMGRHRDTPLMTIGDITPMMNYATVRISGAVERSPYVSRRGGTVEYLSFQVDDGTGALRVSAEDDVAAELDTRQLTPQRGQHVEVTGRLTVKADGKHQLRLQSAGDVNLE
jgi:hypothetical protein